MKQKQVAYQIVPDSKMRRWLSAAFRSARHTPMMHGLVKVDVTRAQMLLRDYKAKTGETKPRHGWFTNPGSNHDR